MEITLVLRPKNITHWITFPFPDYNHLVKKTSSNVALMNKRRIFERIPEKNLREIREEMKRRCFVVNHGELSEDTHWETPGGIPNTIYCDFFV